MTDSQVAALAALADGVRYAGGNGTSDYWRGFNDGIAKLEAEVIAAGVHVGDDGLRAALEKCLDALIWASGAFVGDDMGEAWARTGQPAVNVGLAALGRTPDGSAALARPAATPAGIDVETLREALEAVDVRYAGIFSNEVGPGPRTLAAAIIAAIEAQP